MLSILFGPIRRLGVISRYPLLEVPSVVKIVRVYNDGTRREFAMNEQEAEDHLRYSIAHRFGCAHFRDGVCVSRGYLTEDRCRAIEAELCGGSVSVSVH